MHFTLVQNVFWGAGVTLNLALLFVLLFRRRWSQFPVVTTWMAFLVLRSITLFLVYSHSSKHWYSVTYWSGYAIDFALQLGIVLEIARIVLRPTGSWVRDARARFAVGGLGGIAVAALFTWWIAPPGSSVVLSWQVRGNLFTSMVICELFVLMTLTANQLGLGWRNHVMAIGQGLTAWSTVMLVKTAVESILGTGGHYFQIEHIRDVTYIAAVCWMILQLWRDEPERRPISPELHEYILALHRRVGYDLGRLDARH